MISLSRDARVPVKEVSPDALLSVLPACLMRRAWAVGVPGWGVR